MPGVPVPIDDLSLNWVPVVNERFMFKFAWHLACLIWRSFESSWIFEWAFWFEVMHGILLTRCPEVSRDVREGRGLWPWMLLWTKCPRNPCCRRYWIFLRLPEGRRVRWHFLCLHELSDAHSLEVPNLFYQALRPVFRSSSLFVDHDAFWFEGLLSGSGWTETMSEIDFACIVCRWLMFRKDNLLRQGMLLL
jgi:hypothetical protein